MSRKQREKDRKELELRASMSPEEREQLERRERERYEQLEQRRAERREQQEIALYERKKKRQRERMKRIFAYSSIPIGVIVLIVVIVTFFRPASTVFSYSDWINNNGFWKGIKALDYVEKLDYRALPIPAGVHQISDDAVQKEIDHILADYAHIDQVKDRPVVDGDQVNIDFTGSIDGVEFEGGSTYGEGEDVTIGVTQYIDDFLEQLIGHMPGETINVEVTFPDDYSTEELQGKDALFITTINYINAEVLPDLTDEFVAENLFDEYGWDSVEEMLDQTRSELSHNAVQDYAIQYLCYEAGVQSIPNQLLDFQRQALLSTYRNYAASSGMDLDDFVSAYIGYPNADALLEDNQENFLQSAIRYLVIQAVAEDAGISVSNEDIESFFIINTGDGDYSSYEDQFGLPYLKQIVLNQKVIDFITDNVKYD